MESLFTKMGKIRLLVVYNTAIEQIYSVVSPGMKAIERKGTHGYLLVVGAINSIRP
jgi:hypothetical protein